MAKRRRKKRKLSFKVKHNRLGIITLEPSLNGKSARVCRRHGNTVVRTSEMGPAAAERVYKSLG